MSFEHATVQLNVPTEDALQPKPLEKEFGFERQKLLQRLQILLEYLKNTKIIASVLDQITALLKEPATVEGIKNMQHGIQSLELIVKKYLKPNKILGEVLDVQRALNVYVPRHEPPWQELNSAVEELLAHTANLDLTTPRSTSEMIDVLLHCKRLRRRILDYTTGEAHNIIESSRPFGNVEEPTSFHTLTEVEALSDDTNKRAAA